MIAMRTQFDAVTGLPTRWFERPASRLHGTGGIGWPDPVSGKKKPSSIDEGWFGE